jgi:hypothetical protein
MRILTFFKEDPLLWIETFSFAIIIIVEMILINHNNFIGDVLKYLEYKKN